MAGLGVFAENPILASAGDERRAALFKRRSERCFQASQI
jgi:hypothetical protein